MTLEERETYARTRAVEIAEWACGEPRCGEPRPNLNACGLALYLVAQEWEVSATLLKGWFSLALSELESRRGRH